MSSPADIARAIEHAAQQLSGPNRAAAEKTLVEFRSSSRPYEVCIIILEKSTAHDAQFQALVTMKEALLREWSILGPDTITSMRDGLIKLALTRGTSMERTVLRQLWRVVAIIFKRAWFKPKAVTDAYVHEDAVSSRLMETVNGLLAMPELRQKAVAMTFLLEVFEQMSATQVAVELGLSWEYHVRAHRSFETTILRPLFELTVKVLQTLAGVIKSPPAGFDITFLVDTLSVIERALMWEFEEQISSSALQYATHNTHTSYQLIDEMITKYKLRSLRAVVVDEVVSSLRPGASWTDLLVRSPLIELLLDVYSTMRTSLKGELGIRAGSHVRLALQQLASLKGTVFPSAGGEADDRIRLEYVQRLINGAGVMLKFAFADHSKVGTGEEKLNEAIGDEVSSSCMLYQHLMDNFSLSTIIRLPNVTGFLNDLCALTVQLLNPSLSAATAEWATEAFSTLLEAWVNLVNEYETNRRSMTAEQQTGLAELLSKYTQQIFKAFFDQQIAAAMKEAARTAAGEEGEEDEQFKDNSYRSEQFGNIALLARLNVAGALSILISKINEQKLNLERFGTMHLSAIRDNGGRLPPLPAEVRPVQWQDELSFAVELTGYVLADRMDGGDTCVIPEQIILASKAVSTDGNDIIIAAAESIWNLLLMQNQFIQHYTTFEREGKGAGRLALSPFLAETLVDFLQRWTLSYLMPSESLYGRIPERLFRTWGQSTRGAIQVVEWVVDTVYTNLMGWSNEKSLCEKSCSLLHGMVENSKLRRNLSAAPAWAKIIGAYHATYTVSDSGAMVVAGPLANLSNKVVRKLIQTMVLVAAGEGTPEGKARHDACTAVLGPINQRMSRHADMLRSRVRSSDAIEQLLVTINLLRGVAKATGTTFEVAFAFLQPFFGGLTDLVAMFATIEPRVVTAILKLFRDLAATEVSFLAAPQQVQLMMACVNIVAAFGRANHERLSRLKTSSAGSSGSHGSGFGGSSSSSSAASSRDESAEDDQYNDVTTLLVLLAHISGKEMADIDRAAVASASEASLQGLMILSPHLSHNMLTYPKICSSYFALLSDLVTTHIDRFATLPAEARSIMIGSLTFAINHHIEDIARDGLKALDAIGKYHFHCKRAAMGIPDEPEPAAASSSGGSARAHGRLPVERKSSAKKSLVAPAGSLAASIGPSPFTDDIISRNDFMARLLNILLFETTSAVLLEPLADALLPLVVAEPEHYSGTVDRLIAAKLITSDDGVRKRVWDGFSELVSNNIGRNLHKTNRFQFRDNVRRLVAGVRSFLQQK